MKGKPLSVAIQPFSFQRDLNFRVFEMNYKNNAAFSPLIPVRALKCRISGGSGDNSAVN